MMSTNHATIIVAWTKLKTGLSKEDEQRRAQSAGFREGEITNPVSYSGLALRRWPQQDRKPCLSVRSRAARQGGNQ